MRDTHDGLSGSNNVAAAGLELNGDGGAGGNNNLVYNNTIVHIGQKCMIFWSNADSNDVYNNITYDCCTSGDSTDCEAGSGDTHWLKDAASNNNDIQYNLILDVDSGVEDPGELIISEDYGSPQTVSYANTNYSEYSNNLDDYSPTFINYSSRSVKNLHLQSTSEVIDEGSQVTDSVWGTVGYEGVAPDLGAFEYRAVE